MKTKQELIDLCKSIGMAISNEKGDSFAAKLGELNLLFSDFGDTWVVSVNISVGMVFDDAKISKKQKSIMLIKDRRYNGSIFYSTK